MLIQLIRDRTWHHNVATVQFLGLCPLLAVSNNIENAVGLSIASTFVLLSSAVLVSLMRGWIPTNVRLPFFVLIIATFTTIAMLTMEALLWDLYLRIALFVQIIVTNCMILGRVEQSASKESVGIALTDALATALGFSCVLIVLGSLREFLTPFMPLVGEPSGAFILFGLMLAAIQYFKREPEQTNRNLQATPAQQSQSHD